MFPSLIPGDEVALVPVTGAISSGDVIGFLGPSGKATMHRVLGVCAVAGTVLTAGDNNRGPDVPLPVHAVVGRVVRVRRRILGGWVTIPEVLWRSRLLPIWLSRPLWRVCAGAHRVLPFDFRRFPWDGRRSLE